MPIQTQPQLFVIGALHVDEIATADTPFILGESNPVSWIQRVGGVAANAARAASAAAPDTNITLLANCGNDANAQNLRSAMLETGVDVLTPYTNRCNAGRYCAVIQPNGDVLIGLADVSQAEAISAEAITEHLHKLRVDAILLDGNLSATTIKEFAAAPQTKTALMAVCVSPAKSDRFVESLAFLDVLFCNRQEAAALTAKIENAADGSVEPKLESLCSQGCAHIVMTDGANGVHIQSGRDHSHLTANAIENSHTLNGPGDALAGATAANLLTADITHQRLTEAVLTRGMPAAGAVLAGDNVAPLINTN